MLTYKMVDEDGELVEIDAPFIPESPVEGEIYTSDDAKLVRFDGQRFRPVSPAELD